MSFDSFSLLSPRIRRMMIIHSGESTQANNTQPSALRPLFLAMLAGMWIQKSHNTTKMATNTMIGAASVICRYKLYLVSISTNVQNNMKSVALSPAVGRSRRRPSLALIPPARAGTSHLRGHGHMERMLTFLVIIGK